MVTAVILLSLALVGLTLELFRVRAIYEALYQIILADRDLAREEVKTVRAALFPQLSRVAPVVAKSDPKAPLPPPRWPPPGPWRVNFKNLVRKHSLAATSGKGNSNA